MTEPRPTATPEESLEDRLRFETLLSEISARFINLPAGQIDSAIEDAQGRICELLSLDRSTLWQIHAGEPGTMRLTHWRLPPGGSTPAKGMDAVQFFPWTVRRILAGETVILSKLDDLPPEAGRDLENYLAYRTKSNVSVPLSSGEGPIFGNLTFAVMREERDWSETAVKWFKLIAQVFANALARKRAELALRKNEEQLKENLKEIKGLKERLERENIYLQEEIKQLVEYTDIVGQSAAIKKVLSQAEQVARTDSTVLLLGETGTGKELLARAIHSLSSRKGRPRASRRYPSPGPGGGQGIPEENGERDREHPEENDAGPAVLFLAGQRPGAEEPRRTRHDPEPGQNPGHSGAQAGVFRNLCCRQPPGYGAIALDGRAGEGWMADLRAGRRRRGSLPEKDDPPGENEETGHQAIRPAPAQIKSIKDLLLCAFVFMSKESSFLPGVRAPDAHHRLPHGLWMGGGPLAGSAGLPS